jgi:NAD-dependent deacetylase
MFGDQLPAEPWQAAVTVSTQCDCMVIVGTSQLVVPAATLPVMAKSSGAQVIRVDPVHGECDIWLQGSAGEVLPRLFETHQER